MVEFYFGTSLNQLLFNIEIGYNRNRKGLFDSFTNNNRLVVRENKSYGEEGEEKKFSFKSDECKYKISFWIQSWNDLNGHPSLVVIGVNESIDPTIRNECYRELAQKIGDRARNETDKIRKTAYTEIVDRLHRLGYPHLDPDTMGG